MNSVEGHAPWHRHDRVWNGNMALRRSQTAPHLGKHGVFGDEEAAQLRADIDGLRVHMADLAAQVAAQFTSIAAHAEIAREQIALARDEARADMERTRETLFGLLETVRGEMQHSTGTAPGASASAAHERIGVVEAAVDELRNSLDTAIAGQQRMGDTMAAFIDTMLAEARNEPVAGLVLG
jgi:alkylated DNA repair dioxygenase AlkB